MSDSMLHLLYQGVMLKRKNWLQLFSFGILYLSAMTAAPTVSAGILADPSDCQRNCGNITVPYPFGLGDSDICYKDSTYKLICNESLHPPSLSMDTRFSFVNISAEKSTALVIFPISFACYNMSGISSRRNVQGSLARTPFFISTINKFMAIGCDTFSGLFDLAGQGTGTGCFSVCNSSNIPGQTYVRNFTEELESCEGIGCCQAAVPKGLNTLYMYLSSAFNHSKQLETNPCSFAFLADPTWYRDVSNFSLVDTHKEQKISHVVLDWAIRGSTRELAKQSGKRDDYVCGQNTDCINSGNGPGYICSCKEGFQGNPYTDSGCEDINECDDPQRYPCTGKCKNSPGKYTCTCPFGQRGDGKFGCTLSTASKVVIGLGAGVLFASLGNLLFWLYKKKLQERNHRKNGGAYLEELSIRSFKEKQLQKATDNYDAKQLLGEGGNGWVYRGSLEDSIHIAVKKSKLVDQNHIEQFLNEADIVSKINHKNIVKLIGVCLDSKIPMLVYEFVPNGTLYQHLHGKKSKILDSWRVCLRIAAEIARALEYMHSLAYPPIIHQDIKTSNILLDGAYTAKVADFGASKLIRFDRTLRPEQAQGTTGYLDPEYLQTGELTTRSDVYGFGVVVMELLSKLKPLSRGMSGEIISLVQFFTSAVENDNYDQVLNVTEVTEQETEQVYLVAELAIRCVAMPSKNRPTMTQVTGVLNGLSKELAMR